MGRALAQESLPARQVFQQADELLAYPLSRMCWDGPAEDLGKTEHTQPAILTHSAAVLSALEEAYPGFRPAYTAGHSLGEYSALLASGAVSFADALRLVRERGRAMEQAGNMANGGMAAVLGLELPQVEQTCSFVTSQIGQPVCVANDNCPGQIVISGEASALVQACHILEASGARRVVRLNVSVAAHSPLMLPAQERLERALDAIEFRDPEIVVYGNVHAAPLSTASEIQADLQAQLTSRVRWTETIQALIQLGVETFIEVGPGSVLSGLIRRINPDSRCLAFDHPLSFKRLED